jgi:pyridoxal phosphate-dependent aminotransferase EpsN
MATGADLLPGVPWMSERILLSPPHMTGEEQDLIAEAFATNWVAPLGPHVDAFEHEFAAAVGGRHAAALSSGTAALHLALRIAGVGPGDEVFVSTLTFAASVNPVLYVGARPVFIDSERATWNLNAALLADVVERKVRQGHPPRAVVLVHLYGHPADIGAVQEICDRHGILLIEDAAEALGARYRGRAPGTFGKAGVFSFNGNKIITTSGGGMLVSDDRQFIEHARKLATQARDPAPHYEHSEIGYNYRLSNVLAAIGRAQLRVLGERVAARRRNFEYYRRTLGDLPGLAFMPEAEWALHTRWLTTLTIDEREFGASREEVRCTLEQEGIEARPVWKPMHMQPVYRAFEAYGGEVAQDLFERGLCLPSGSALTDEQLARVVAVIRQVYERANSQSLPVMV